MSGGYASRLSEYPKKGVCGLKELKESPRTLKNKLNLLLELIESSKYITVLTGAGISTSAGIPDFRGPTGIWTLEKKKKETTKEQKSQSLQRKRKRFGVRNSSDVAKPSNELNLISNADANDNANTQNRDQANEEVSFEKAKPTLTHYALAKLVDSGKISFVITQNVDGLHRRSGLLPQKNQLAVLHGCIFTEVCEDCGTDYFRNHDVGTISRQRTGRTCIHCGGALRDTLLDWDDELPEDDYEKAQDHCRRSDLVLALGTSLRIEPAGNLPTLGQRYVIVNLQRTPYDDNACLLVRAKVDDVFSWIMPRLCGGEEKWEEWLRRKKMQAEENGKIMEQK